MRLWVPLCLFMNLSRSFPFIMNLSVLHFLLFSSSSIAGRTWNITRNVSPGNWCRLCVQMYGCSIAHETLCWVLLNVFTHLSFFLFGWLSFSRSIKWTAIKIEALRDQIVWMTKWDWFLVNSKTLATAGNAQWHFVVRYFVNFVFFSSSFLLLLLHVTDTLMGINSNINNS